MTWWMNLISYEPLNPGEPSVYKPVVHYINCAYSLLMRANNLEIVLFRDRNITYLATPDVFSCILLYRAVPICKLYSLKLKALYMYTYMFIVILSSYSQYMFTVPLLHWKGSTFYIHYPTAVVFTDTTVHYISIGSIAQFPGPPPPANL